MHEHRSMWRPSGGAVALSAALAVLASGVTYSAGDKAREGMVARADLEVVDCLLPGQVRRLGNTTYLTQRRPTRTTAGDCAIRGGDYVAYDRADYKSALRVWMDAAQAGDAEAQNNVGEIYERGLKDTPNYEAAVIWYQKAADQGNSRAQFNLGTLYEQGLGVPQDKVRALDLYRKAWGIPADSIVFKDEAEQENAALRQQLQTQIADKDAQIEALNQQVGALQSHLQQLQHSNKEDTALKKQVETLSRLMADLRADRDRSQEQFARIRSPSVDTTAAPPPDPNAFERYVKGLNFGRFYAIIIGNQTYQNLEQLQTPRNDAERAAKVLRDKYGFSVQVLEDANDDAMLAAFNDLNKILKENDNVLIYYAGHGSRQKTPGVDLGYWLPVNAERPPSLRFWVGTDQISSYLGIFRARRVLVLADSCYAGLLSTDPGLLVFSTQTQAAMEYLKYKLPKRSRLLLASGGDNPVLDVGGNGDSVFARAFIDVLESNSQLLSTPALFARLQERVKTAAARNNFQQTPELKSIKSAGHEVGDFFFVPKSGI